MTALSYPDVRKGMEFADDNSPIASLLEQARGHLYVATTVEGRSRRGCLHAARHAVERALAIAEHTGRSVDLDSAQYSVLGRALLARTWRMPRKVDEAIQYFGRGYRQCSTHRPHLFAQLAIGLAEGLYYKGSMSTARRQLEIAISMETQVRSFLGHPQTNEAGSDVLLRAQHEFLDVLWRGFILSFRLGDTAYADELYHKAMGWVNSMGPEEKRLSLRSRMAADRKRLGRTGLFHFLHPW